MGNVSRFRLLVQYLKVECCKWLGGSNLHEIVSPAADQPESRAVGHPPFKLQVVTLITLIRGELHAHLLWTNLLSPSGWANDDADEHVLKDGEKTARVNPNTGVKQGCPLYPLIFSLYVDDIDEIAEGVQGAVTGHHDAKPLACMC
eukprot:1148310-Pelagomonas_calceolata.AAC.2